MKQEEKQDPWRDQIQYLVNLAFEKGLAQAIKEASKLRDPFLIDKFHDTLVNELYEQLIERQHKK